METKGDVVPYPFGDRFTFLLHASNTSLSNSDEHISFFILGGNRFEVTLEKSNKNFSKKIQQVSDFFSRLTANLDLN